MGVIENCSTSANIGARYPEIVIQIAVTTCMHIPLQCRTRKMMLREQNHLGLFISPFDDVTASWYFGEHLGEATFQSKSSLLFNIFPDLTDFILIPPQRSELGVFRALQNCRQSVHKSERYCHQLGFTTVLAREPKY